MSIFSNNLRILRQNSELKQSEIAELVGITPSTWSNYEIDKTEPNIETLVKIANSLNVSVDGLLTRDLSLIAESLIKGNLISKNQSGKITEKGNPKGNLKGNLNLVAEPNPEWQRVPKVVTVNQVGEDNVVFVPVKARAGYLLGYGDQEFIQSLPTYRFPGLASGIYRGFEIEGQSMLGTFYSSDWIVGSFVDNLAEIRDDRIHIVVTKSEGIVVKRVLNRIEKDKKLILNSDNQRTPLEYPPLVIDPEDVLEIWYGVRFSSSQMRRPGEMAKRVNDIDARLTLIEHGLKK